MIRRMLLGVAMVVLAVECARAVDDADYPPDVRRKARELATVVAGDSSREEFERVYVGILQATNVPCCGSARSGVEEAPSRSAEEVMAELENDETFQRNIDLLLAEDPEYIINGIPTETTEFLEVVLIRIGTRGICTGTLIGPNVVLSAKHCFPSDTRPETVEVRVGNSSASRTRYTVSRIVVHPSADLAVLVLAENVSNQDAIPTRIASPSDIQAAAGARIVGFGLTEKNTSGTKMRADVGFVRYDCRPGDPFGCRSGEMVLGGLHVDTCHGDSGGPAMIQTPSGFALAGVTSRAISDSKTMLIGNQRYRCGYGGIYVNARHYYAAIKQMAEQNGGTLVDGDTPSTETAEPVSDEVNAALDQLKSGILMLERALQAQ